MNKSLTLSEATQKIEYFCKYQERCHQEVISKLYTFRLSASEIDQVVVQLIENDFLNEERFACAFARGKHRIKSWGKIRIISELKFRHISQYNITKALREISAEEYNTTFHKSADKHWENRRETNKTEKRKKFCDYMMRKGYESNIVYEKVKDLEGV